MRNIRPNKRNLYALRARNYLLYWVHWLQITKQWLRQQIHHHIVRLIGTINIPH